MEDQEKTLTLKSLEKQTKTQISNLEKLLSMLQRKIENIEKSLRR